MGMMSGSDEETSIFRIFGRIEIEKKISNRIKFNLIYKPDVLGL